MTEAARVVIIADDLSGAADCAVSCAVQGLHTVVELSESWSQGAQVLAIDSATRSMSAERAAATVGRLVANFQHAPDRVLFKKLDSLLRGHIGPELAAMRIENTPNVIVMAPALPAQRRTTVDGCVWMNGERVPNAKACRLLESAGLTSAQITLDLVRGARRPLAARMAELAQQSDAVICDAETEDDLSAIAVAIAALPDAGWHGSVIWAGSSGLARHIPDAMGIVGAPACVNDPSFRGPILLAVGSRSQVAHEQSSKVAQVNGITSLVLSSVLLASEGLREKHARVMADAFESGSDVMAVIDQSGDSTENPGLCSALASLISPNIERIGALIVTGGETARSILTASNIKSLRLLREVEPGVPLAISAGVREFPVITKSGSFGDHATLAHCVQVLRGMKLE